MSSDFRQFGQFLEDNKSPTPLENKGVERKTKLKK